MVGAAMVVMGVVCFPILFRKSARDLIFASVFFFHVSRLKLCTSMKETTVSFWLTS